MPQQGIFLSVMKLLNLDMRQKSGNYVCPFCFKESFTVYPDERAYCHACKWPGDAIQLYSDKEDVSRDEAYKAISIALKKNFIELKEQTYSEAKIALAKDLDFLAKVRMYESFYDRPYRIERPLMEEMTGLSKSELNKIINGRIGNVLTWRKTLNVLRGLIPIKKFEKDLELKEKYFEQLLDDEGQRLIIEKYRIKKSRKPRAKTKSEIMKERLRVDK